MPSDENLVNVYLDDKRDPEVFDHFGKPRLSAEQRNDGISWIWVKTVEEVKQLLEAGLVRRLSLDNDLGMLEEEGREVVRWMADKDIWPEGPITVHSDNVVAKDYMLKMMDRYAPDGCAIMRNLGKRSA